MTSVREVFRRAGPGASRRIRQAVLEGRRPRRVLDALGLRLGTPGLSIPMGRFFPTSHSPSGLVVCFVALGVPAQALASTAMRIAEAQLVTAAFRPLLVVDGEDLDLARRYGWAVERLVPREEWESLDRAASWTGYATNRIAEIARSYGASSVVPVPTSGLDECSWPALLSVGTV